MVRGIVFGIVALIVSFTIMSPGAYGQDTQLWTALISNGPAKKNSRLLLWFDGHARYSDDISRLGVSILRPAIGYKISDRISVWSGYAYVVSRADGRDNIVDHRIWQQATYVIGQGEWGKLSGRTRFEQRFLNTGDDTGYRVRQFVRYSKPLDLKWTFTAWNETFFALNDTDFGAEDGFDQNRTFVGANYVVSKRLKLEGGYLLNQIRRPGRDGLTNHNISLSFVVPL